MLHILHWILHMEYDLWMLGVQNPLENCNFNLFGLGHALENLFQYSFSEIL